MASTSVHNRYTAAYFYAASYSDHVAHCDESAFAAWSRDLAVAYYESQTIGSLHSVQDQFRTWLALQG